MGDKINMHRDTAGILREIAKLADQYAPDGDPFASSLPGQVPTRRFLAGLQCGIFTYRRIRAAKSFSWMKLNASRVPSRVLH